MSAFIRRLPHAERELGANHCARHLDSHKSYFPLTKISFGPFRFVLVQLPPPEGGPLSALSLPTSACSGPPPSALRDRWLPRSIRSTVCAGTDLRVIRLERVER